MKYLIDNLNKSGTSLIGKYQFMKPDDEFRIYDSDICNNGNVNLSKMNAYIKDENGNISFADIPDDSRQFITTNDFDSALEWCDAYVTFRGEKEFGSTSELEKGKIIVEHANKARELGKYILIANPDNSPNLQEIALNYDKCINPFINENDLKELKNKYGEYFTEGMQYDFTGTTVTLVVGTNGNSGKLTAGLDFKRRCEANGENVALICTEESFPLLDCTNEHIYPCSSKYSLLSTSDEDELYFYHLVAKIIAEQNPDRIIICSQGGFGSYAMNMPVNIYGIEKSRRKLNDITTSFDSSSIIICSNANTLNRCQRIYDYLKLERNIEAVYVSPKFDQFGTEIIADENGNEFCCEYRGRTDEVWQNISGFMLLNPQLNVICNYADINDRIANFKNSEMFINNSAKAQIMKWINDALLFTNVNKDIYKQIASNINIVEDDSQYETAMDMARILLEELNNNNNE